MTTKDDVMMNNDHVIKCPEGTNTGNHGDSQTSNPPPVVFTPAKEIINEGTYIRMMHFCYMIYHNIYTVAAKFCRLNIFAFKFQQCNNL